MFKTFVSLIFGHTLPILCPKIPRKNGIWCSIGWKKKLWLS